MRHLQGAKWLAKDVIWVLPDAACGGALHALSHWVHIYQVSCEALHTLHCMLLHVSCSLWQLLLLPAG
jgi:hypothetical protein